MRHILAGLLLLGIVSTAAAKGTALAPHPRLLITDADLAAARSAEHADPLRADLRKRIIDAATDDLTARPLAHVLEGPRLLAQSRRAIGYIVTCAMAYRLTGERRFADRARSDMLTVAAFPDWNPSHFLDVAEMSFAVAVGYDWLYRELSPKDRETIENALIEKALVFAPMAYDPPGKPDPRLFFATARMNWNQVCNGGLLAAALAVGDKRPDLQRLVVEGVRKSLPLAMAAYEPDGAYPEGPAYWSYGTTYNAIILALLEGAYGTDFGLGDSRAFARTALYRTAAIGPTGLAFNYADGETGVEPTPAYAWLAVRYHDEASLENSREILRSAIQRRAHDRFLALNETWFPASSAGGATSSDPALDIGELPLAVHLRGAADIAIMRSAWSDPRALFVGFKAGDNSTNHAHLDLGSFVLESDGVRWALDLGPDDYNLPGYFGDMRWTYYRLNNRSHNTITPGDRLQDPKATAPIIAFSESRQLPFAVADLTPAYPGSAKKMLRGVEMVGGSAVLVQDDISGLAPDTEIHWVMMTAAAVSISADGATATLSEEGRTLRADILSPADARFATVPATPPAAAEDQNRGDTVLTLVMPRIADPDIRIAVEFTPVGDIWPLWRPISLKPLQSWRSAVLWR